MWWCEGVPCKKLGMTLIELLEVESPHEMIHIFLTGTTRSFFWVLKTCLSFILANGRLSVASVKVTVRGDCLSDLYRK